MIINDTVVNIFEDIKLGLSHCLLFKRKMKFMDYLIKALFKYFGINIKYYLNYNYLAKSFNKNYFLKNLLKCLLLFDYIYCESGDIGEEILDVGCGGATASIAIYSLMKKKAKKEVKITLIDKSEEQLNIASLFLKTLSIKLLASNIRNFKIEYNQYNELVVFSYFVCEQGRGFVKSLYENKERFTNGFVVIDYEKNIDKINNYFDKNGYTNKIEVLKLEYDTPNNLLNILYKRKINVYGCIYRP